MPLIDRRTLLRTSVAAGASAPLLGATLGAARADDKTYVMKLGTATINEAQHEWCKRFVAMVEKDSGGRIKGEIYPASQLGPIRARGRRRAVRRHSRAISARPNFWSASTIASRCCPRRAS